MEFISNLIKRPMSLVLNESPTSSDKYPTSSSLPNPPSVLSEKRDVERRRPLTALGHSSDIPTSTMTHSNSANVTELVGAPDLLGEFEDILPPPVCLSAAKESLSQTCNGQPNTPNTPQIIEELLLQINDNLNEASLGEETLSLPAMLPSVAQSSRVDEVTTLPTKSQSNSRLFTTPTALSATATAPSTTITNLSVPHAITHITQTTTPTLLKFDGDSGLEVGLLDHQRHLGLKLAYHEDTGVNKSSNKFVGLTEFDEANIPELPNSLNPDLEEQLKLTFEEGLIPTLTATISKKDDVEDNTHLLLPNETDTAVSSDNELFADCRSYEDVNSPIHDDLTTEQPSETTEAESYRSAVNITESKDNDSDGNVLNATMENIADLTLDAVESSVPESAQSNDRLLQTATAAVIPDETHVDTKDHVAGGTGEEEPMDIDMNATMEMETQNTANTTPPGQGVVEHVANEDKQLNVDIVTDRSPEVSMGTSVPQCEKTPLKAISVQNTQDRIDSRESKHLEIEGFEPEGPINKSVELSPNNSYSMKECVTQDRSVDSVSNGLSVESHEDNISESPEGAPIAHNATVNLSPNPEREDNISGGMSPTAASAKTESSFETSANEKSSLRQTDVKLNVTLDMTSSVDSLKSSASNSPSFPTKSTQDTTTFPQSHNGSGEMVFIEKSMKEASPSATSDKSPTTDLHRADGDCIDGGSMKQSSSSNGAMSVLNSTFDGNVVCSPNMTKSIGAPGKVDGDQPESLGREPSASLLPMASPNNSESDVDTNRRRTFCISTPQHLSKETHTHDGKADNCQSAANTSYEPMDVDETLSESVIRALPTSSTSPSRTVMQKLPQSPPIPTLQKCSSPSIAIPPPPPTRELPSLPSNNSLPQSQTTTPVIEEELSVKEQTKCSIKDEKDIFVEKQNTPSPLEDVATSVLAAFTTTNTIGSNPFGSLTTPNATEGLHFSDTEFQGRNNLILNPSDFDYLLTKGNNNAPVDRSSLLLRFDPLLGVAVPTNQTQQQTQSQSQQLQLPGNNNNNNCLSPTAEEDESNESNSSSVTETITKKSSIPTTFGAKVKKEPIEVTQGTGQKKSQYLEGKSKQKNARMSVDVIKDMSLDNDCNKTFENSNTTQSDEKQINFKMDELEKKIKNEVLKTEDIEKKLKDAEQREEALIKRITEKDKTISKMNGVIEAYEKAIAELIAEKEQIIQNYEKQLAEVKADRDSNYHHLTSLETTFSDLHVKYEKSKEMTSQLKASEEALLAEKRQNLENLRLQEQRYEKMKNHAMQQLEIANKKLESLSKEHSIETTKLKALLKKEEIARSSINEQLQQKARENAELVKICDELINGQGS